MKLYKELGEALKISKKVYFKKKEVREEKNDVGQGVGDPAAPDDVTDGKLARQEVGDGDVITQHRDDRDNPGDGEQGDR